jgi:hypothetical protein
VAEVNAEIGIDDEGRAYLQLTPSSQTEHSMLNHMRSFLPVKVGSDDAWEFRITGDRLPGSGPGRSPQDATTKAATTKAKVENVHNISPEDAAALAGMSR